MEAAQALSVIQALANGKNPSSGEYFPADSLYQEAQTVRALMIAVQILQQSIEAERRKQSLPGNVGKSWSQEDEAILINEFDAGRNIAELAHRLHRTNGAVHARLIKLGKISDEAPFQPYRRSTRE